MMSHIAQNIEQFLGELAPKQVQLVAVTKTKAVSVLMEAYQAGFKRFGENYVQELVEKYEQLPKDIEWHFIGHLQSNKVKYIAPFVSLIHGVDSWKLLQEIDKQAQKNERVINCLLQVYIAQEDSKMGMTETEVETLLSNAELKSLKNIQIVGLMGMASFSDKQEQVKNEFAGLKTFFDQLNEQGHQLKILSMGMSGDYQLAIETGSNMVRIGSAIFGTR